MDTLKSLGIRAGVAIPALVLAGSMCLAASPAQAATSSPGSGTKIQNSDAGGGGGGGGGYTSWWCKRFGPPSSGGNGFWGGWPGCR